MVISLAIISLVAFIIIQLPPGDFVDYLRTRSMGYESTPLTEADVAALKAQYGLDRPLYVQYFTWVYNALRGDFGTAFLWNRPVSELIGERLPLSVALAGGTLIFTYAVAIPIGFYSAMKQYSVGDYVVTILGFIGLAIPNFLFALIMLVIVHQWFGVLAVGLFSPEYENAAWSWGRFVDLLGHLWIPMLVIGTAGTAEIIRVFRSVLLDELDKQYVNVARAKGLRETWLTVKYPVREAMNPVVSMIGWELPAIISGETIVAVVLNLPTLGPLLLQSLQSQDMYLAAACIMLMSVIVVVGTFLSDLLLMFLDPRIRA
jgi:peptide/nickel transport system permease protein